jgi:hypothetical protein
MYFSSGIGVVGPPCDVSLNPTVSQLLEVIVPMNWPALTGNGFYQHPTPVKLRNRGSQGVYVGGITVPIRYDVGLPPTATFAVNYVNMQNNGGTWSTYFHSPSALRGVALLYATSPPTSWIYLPGGETLDLFNISLSWTNCSGQYVTPRLFLEAPSYVPVATSSPNPPTPVFEKSPQLGGIEETYWEFQEFTCGEVNGNGIVNISDVVYLIAFIFSSGPAPIPYLAGDVNCNQLVNIADVVYMIAYIFSGGPEPCEACL